MKVNEVPRMTMSDRPVQLLNIVDAAAMLDITPKGLRALLSRREIASTKVGRLRKVPVSAIEAYIQRNTITAAEGR